MLTQQEAIIGKLHDIFAYPQQGAALLDEFEKLYPEAAAWLCDRMGGEHDKAVVEEAARVPVVFAELPKVDWREVWAVAAEEDDS